MDFVNGLGDTANTLEISADAIGRVEIHKGLVRITMSRTVQRDGIAHQEPCVTIVWSLQSWLEAQAPYAELRALIAALGHNVSGDEVLRHHH